MLKACTQSREEQKMKSSVVDTPYFTTEEAALYVRYSVQRFKRYVEAAKIPTYGPQGNRFRRDDLDEWMENPNAFKRSNHSPCRRGVRLRSLPTGPQMECLRNRLGRVRRSDL